MCEARWLLVSLYLPKNQQISKKVSKSQSSSPKQSMKEGKSGYTLYMIYAKSEVEL